MSLGLIVLTWTGFLTESTCVLGYKQSALTPIKRLLTSWPKARSLVNGGHSWHSCSILWHHMCALPAISVQQRRHDVKIGMLMLSQKVPACAQLVCVRYKWRRTTRQTMLLAWNTHPRRKRLGATISDNKASRQAQPLNTLQDGSSMRQQSKLQVQLTKDEFTTSDPTLICQPIKWSRRSSERSSTESKLENSERCDISWKRPQWNKQFGIFMNQCIWALLHLSKDEKELRRILKNYSVRKIMANIETLQAQLNKLTFRDSQIFGTHLVFDCRDNNRKHISLISLLSEPVVKITHTTVYVFTDPVLCLGGRCQG